MGRFDEVTPSKYAELAHASMGSLRHAVEMRQGGFGSWSAVADVLNRARLAFERLATIIEEKKQIEVRS